jgi:hypothetical protein
MRPDSDEYYFYQWCGHMRWACVHAATGRDCNWVLAHCVGQIVPDRAGRWEKYQQDTESTINISGSRDGSQGCGGPIDNHGKHYLSSHFRNTSSKNTNNSNNKKRNGEYINETMDITTNNSGIT